MRDYIEFKLFVGAMNHFLKMSARTVVKKDEYQNNELPFKHLTSVEKCFYADFLDHVTFHGASVTITPEILHVLHKYNVWLEGRNRREERGGGGYRKCMV